MNIQSPLFSFSGNLSISFFSVFLFSLTAFAQSISQRANLEEIIKESSGLIYANGQLLTHTDSDGAASLYEINEDDNLVVRTIEVQNATNIDWEDVASDGSYLYVADFGNNVGNRTDLKIYKIALADINATTNDKVTAEIINFSYANQQDFSPHPYDNNFDAEALICYDNNLYIFTKNWSDFKTNIYKLSSQAGEMSIEMIDTIDVNGLISGAVYNPVADIIILTGYSEDNAFIVSISDFEGDLFSTGQINKIDLELPSGTSYQVEGIAFISNDNYIISSETGVFGTGALMDLTFEETLGTLTFERTSDSIFPNPATDYLNVSFKDFKCAEIYTSEGKKIKQSTRRKIFVGDLSSGIYIIKIEDNKRLTKSFKFIRN